MVPIVNGIKKRSAWLYKLACKLPWWNSWHDLLSRLGPQSFFLDSLKQVLYRWFGLAMKEGFGYGPVVWLKTPPCLPRRGKSS
jgi:hypothetical protein